MNSTTAILNESRLRNISFDLIALSIITIIPALSHMISVPLYLLEPMRIVLLISLLHTSKRNGFMLAFILPFFSLLLSNHPSLTKTILIASELTLNVWLFYLLNQKIKNDFLSMFLSIIASKIYYYTIKFFLISVGLMNTELISTPIYLQFLVGIILSFYAYIILRKKGTDFNTIS